MSKKISATTELTAPAAGDLLAIVDVSDTTDAATGTTKKITFGEFQSAPFTNTTAGGGTPTLQVAPTDAIEITNIADAASQSFDVTPAKAWYYGTFVVKAVVKMTGSGDYRRIAATIDMLMNGGISAQGAQAAIPGGDDTGLTLTLTTDGANAFRATLANATGEGVHGYIWIGYELGDGIGD